MVMPATPGQLLAVKFKLMYKTISITLFLIYMNNAAYTQSFNLTDKGLNQIQIGDTINLQNKLFIKPVTERLDFLQINFWSTEYFDYYYVKPSIGNITLDSSIIVKDIFLYTEKIKGNEVGGILLFVNKKYDSILVALLNKVFGPLQIEGSSGAGDEKWRITRLWVKEPMRVFVTDSYTEILKVSIGLRRGNVRYPDVDFRD